MMDLCSYTISNLRALERCGNGWIGEGEMWSVYGEEERCVYMGRRERCGVCMGRRDECVWGGGEMSVYGEEGEMSVCGEEER